MRIFLIGRLADPVARPWAQVKMCLVINKLDRLIVEVRPVLYCSCVCLIVSLSSSEIWSLTTGSKA